MWSWNSRTGHDARVLIPVRTRLLTSDAACSPLGDRADPQSKPLDHGNLESLKKTEKGGLLLCACLQACDSTPVTYSACLAADCFIPPWEPGFLSGLPHHLIELGASYRIHIITPILCQSRGEFYMVQAGWKLLTLRQLQKYYFHFRQFLNTFDITRGYVGLLHTLFPSNAPQRGCNHVW